MSNPAIEDLEKELESLQRMFKIGQISTEQFYQASQFVKGEILIIRSSQSFTWGKVKSTIYGLPISFQQIPTSSRDLNASTLFAREYPNPLDPTEILGLLDEMENIAKQLTAKEYDKEMFGRWESIGQRAADRALQTTAAIVVWKEHNGKIVCECDNDDCFEIIKDITRDEYIKSCGSSGMRRVTSQRCNKGVLGYILVDRIDTGDHWYVWSPPYG